jgi:acyl-CoA thioester hydrolase
LEGYRFTMEQRVVWRDLDALGHVNNAVYATYFENARLTYLADLTESTQNLFGLILAELTITFKAPASLRDTLVIGARVAEIGNSSFMVESAIHDQKTDRLIATSRAVIVHYDYAESRSKPLPPEWRAAIATFEGWPLSHTGRTD